MTDIVSYKMASTIYRLTSLVVIFAIVMIRFGSGLLTNLYGSHDSTSTFDKKLRVRCVVNGVKNPNKSIMAIQIMREGQDRPIAMLDVARGITMGQNSKNILAEGEINSNSSYLLLKIKKPSVEDGGLYRCVMIAVEDKYKTKEESVTAYVAFEHRDRVSELTTRTNGIQEKIDEILNNSCANSEETKIKNKTMTSLDNKMDLIRERTKRTFRANEWMYNEAENTFIKAFGGSRCHDKVSWHTARKNCQAYGGDLVQPGDRKTALFLFKFDVKDHYQRWIGVSKHGKASHYINGSSLESFHLWDRVSYLRDGLSGDKVCVALERDGEETVGLYLGCSTRNSYVCSVSFPNVF